MRVATIALAAAMFFASCAGVGRPQVQNAPKPPGASMWVEPTDLATRDLYNGPWGAANAPDPKDVYDLVELKHTGVNLGMTVKDSKGREWSVKQPFPGNLDSEAPVEVVVSRLLSGIGYHQPAVYFLPAFTLKDDFGRRVETGGRFRLKVEGLKETATWDWAANPFVRTKEYQGLIVLLTMFNSTDLKNSNNSVYERRDGDLVEHWYLARDVGFGVWRHQSHGATQESRRVVRADAVHPRRDQWLCRFRLQGLVQEPDQATHHAGRRGVGVQPARPPQRKADAGRVSRRPLRPGHRQSLHCQAAGKDAAGPCADVSRRSELTAFT